MNEYLKKLWWAISLRGLILLVFGIIAVTAPLMPPGTLITYLGVMSLGMGGITLLVTLSLRKSIQTWLAQVFISVLDILLGAYIMLNTSRAADYFTVIMAAWAIFMGAAMLLVLFRVQGTLRVILLINAMLSVAFGMVLYFKPFTGNNTINFMVGFYTILLSFFLIYLGLRIRAGKWLDKKQETALSDAATEVKPTAETDKR